MLVFTNRELGAETTADAFRRSFAPGSQALSAADVVAGSSSSWQISRHASGLNDKAALDRLMPLFSGDKPLLFYVHGNNNTPADCFKRMADLQKLYGGCVVLGFSWASEGYLSDGSPLPGISAAESGGGEINLDRVNASNRTDSAIYRKIRRYRQAQTNAKDSVDAFARMLRLLGTARLHVNQQPFSLAIHSLGGHLFQYSLQVAGATESASTAHNVALLAPCVRAASHADWVTRFRPKGRTYITYNRGDTVLLGAYIADGEQMKLGMDPGGELVRASGVRYISFSDAPNDLGGHGYFVRRVSKPGKKLFSRIFTSLSDIDPAEPDRETYPAGCDLQGTVCYMAVPKGDPA